jgi:hypothetical protein
MVQGLNGNDERFTKDGQEGDISGEAQAMQSEELLMHSAAWDYLSGVCYRVQQQMSKHIKCVLRPCPSSEGSCVILPHDSSSVGRE